VQASRDEVRQLAEAVTTLVEGAYRGMSRSFDLTRIRLLRLVASSAPVRPSDAADTLDVNPSTVTRYARALEVEGFVHVAGDPTDRRSCLISATEAGRAELDRFAEAGLDVFGAVIQDWTAEDVREFTRHITRLADDWTVRGPAHTRSPRRPAAPRWRADTEGAGR